MPDLPIIHSPLPACITASDAPWLLFGGSFDPPTRAHIDLAAATRDQLFPCARAWLIFVPAARSPLKARSLTPARHRVEMLRLALRGAHRWWVWDEEIRRARSRGGEPSYWIDTIRAGGAPRGQRPARFLIGADQALSFHKWREARALFDHPIAPAVLLRPPSESVDALIAGLRDTGAWDDQDIERWRSLIVELPTTPINATDARTALAEGRRGIESLDPSVERFAIERGLY